MHRMLKQGRAGAEALRTPEPTQAPPARGERTRQKQAVRAGLQARGGLPGPERLGARGAVRDRVASRARADPETRTLLRAQVALGASTLLRAQVALRGTDASAGSGGSAGSAGSGGTGGSAGTGGSGGSSTTKEIALMLFVDSSAVNTLGASNAAALAANAANIANSTYSATLFKYPIQIKLIGIQEWPYGAPSAVVSRACNTIDDTLAYAYDSTYSCCTSSSWYSLGGCPSNFTCVAYSGTTYNVQTQPGCWDYATSWSTYGSKKRVTKTVSGIASTSASEIDDERLLDTFASWVTAHKPQLEATAHNSPDISVLLTARNFANGIIELAFQQAACGNSAAAVLSIGNAEPSRVGWQLSHALGHLLNAQHDFSADWVMSANRNPSVPPTQFSTTSIDAVNSYFDSPAYTGNACFQDSVTPWTGTTCGNGIVETGEGCDTPVGFTDNCCSATTCQLNSGCACASLEPCCTSAGAVKGAGQLCRAAATRLRLRGIVRWGQLEVPRPTKERRQGPRAAPGMGSVISASACRETSNASLTGVPRESTIRQGAVPASCAATHRTTPTA